MRFLYWIDRHAGIYRTLSALLVLLVMLLVSIQIEHNRDDAREVSLAQSLETYSSALESGTVNGRAMGAAILFGLENNEAKQLAQGKLPSNAPTVLAALKNLRTLCFSDTAFLVNQRGEIAAYSQNNAHKLELNSPSLPHIKLAMQGIPNVYPVADKLTGERHILLSAPVRTAFDEKSKIIGAVVVNIDAGKLTKLLNSWSDGIAMLVSPQGLVFASSADKWLFHFSAAENEKQSEDRQSEKTPAQEFLPFTLNEAEIKIDGIRHAVRKRALDWDDPEGDWELVLLDRRDSNWTHWNSLGISALFGLTAALLLFWLFGVARSAVSQQNNYRELSIAAATFESQEGIMITDAQNIILKVNRSFTEITGYTSEEAVGKKPSMLASKRHDQEFYRRMWHAIEHDKIWRGEVWNTRKNGETYPEQLAITPIFGVDGKVVNYVGIFSDITLHKIHEENIHNLAFYDPLTKLPNRRLLNERLSNKMTSSKRDGRYGALMFLDLDYFKQLNDTHGHAMGDLLLIEVAARITHCVREADTVARFGGDEFVVMLSELDTDKAKSATQAGIVAEKIRATLNEPYVLTLEHEDGSQLTAQHRCSSSIGVVLFAGNTASPEELMKLADETMYQAKKSGRNSIRLCDSDNQRA
jgi:diguanylate cyclase (GGDEF)-like protein/PAS domain S-box-containing protein